MSPPWGGTGLGLTLLGWASVLREQQEVGVEAALEPGESDHVGLSAALRPAGRQGVTDVARGTGADGPVVPGLALGALAARLVARRPAVVVVAGAVERALAVVDALAPGAADEGVAPPPGGTGAHRPVQPGPVEPWLAVGPGTARVRRAQVLLLKFAATDKRIPSVATRAGADRLVVGRLTSGALAAHVGVGLVTGVEAPQPDAGLVGGAVVVARTLGVAPGVGVAQEVGRAGALRAVVDRLAVGVLPAHPLAACGLAPVAHPVALLRLAALAVGVALVAAALQRVPDVGVLAPADRPVVLADLAVSVGAAGGADLVPGEPAAVTEGVPGGAPGAPADRHVVLHGAVGALAAGDGARVDALVVLAGPLGAAVLVLVTLTLGGR